VLLAARCKYGTQKVAKNRGVEQRAPPIFGRAAMTLGIDWPTFLVMAAL